MIARPNAFQKLLHRFFMQSSVTAFFAPWIHHLDGTILKLTKGKYAVSEILGWNIIQLTTIGARTNRLHTVPLMGLFDGDKIVLIASSLGRAHHPGWYYNLKKNPGCEVQWNGRSSDFLAHEAERDERDKYWQLALSYYAGYEKYKARAGRTIPVLVLEPKR
jgi:deazaflavin-dependent oxidoreductase (nitroreductase family)